MKTSNFSLKARIHSFRFAFQGIRSFFREEPNARIHLIATMLVLIAAIFFQLSAGERIALVIVTGWVWFAEIMNTAIERAMDRISTEFDPRIGKIKDLAAAAVLVSAFTAVAVAAIIFIPKIIS